MASAETPVEGAEAAAEEILQETDVCAATTPSFESITTTDDQLLPTGTVTTPDQSSSPDAILQPLDVIIAPPPIPPIVEINDLDWPILRQRTLAKKARANLAAIVGEMTELLDQSNDTLMLFDEYRESPTDQAIQIKEVGAGPIWFVGDIHGDLLALEAALTLIREHPEFGAKDARIVFLGDLFDDGGFGLEVLLRIYEIILEKPASVCLVAGNHDEALGHDGTRFTSSVSPADFSEFLNANSSDKGITAVGKHCIRLFEKAPRALFFPDGLLVAHGGFPLTDLHLNLKETQDWNEPLCLSDFVWARAHPTARKKLPNRFTRGGQFGHEDFAEFCSVASSLGRRVTHMVRGHDHVEERYQIYPAYKAHPILTTVALSRRLLREFLGPYERVPTLALFTAQSLPQVFRLKIPEELVREIYPVMSDSGNGTSI